MPLLKLYFKVSIEISKLGTFKIDAPISAKGINIKNRTGSNIQVIKISTGKFILYLTPILVAKMVVIPKIGNEVKIKATHIIKAN